MQIKKKLRTGKVWPFLRTTRKIRRKICIFSPIYRKNDYNCLFVRDYQGFSWRTWRNDVVNDIVNFTGLATPGNRVSHVAPLFLIA